MSTPAALDPHDIEYPDLNFRQRRLRDLAIRKSCTWNFDEDTQSLAIRKLGDYERTGRFLAVYRTGTTRAGARVALIDVSLPADKQLRWITYKMAWALLAENGL